MSKQKIEREMLRLAKAEGVDRCNIDYGGRHNKLTGFISGKPVTFIVPVTPSDGRVMLNIRADIRRKVRELS